MAGFGLDPRGMNVTLSLNPEVEKGLMANVLSEYNRPGGPDAGVKRWLETTDPQTQYVSVMTLAEIQKGIELLAVGRRRVQLEEWLTQDLEAWFSGRVLPVDRQVAARWASLVAQGARAGMPLPTVDSGLLDCGDRARLRSDHLHPAIRGISRAPAQPPSIHGYLRKGKSHFAGSKIIISSYLSRLSLRFRFFPGGFRHGWHVRSTWPAPRMLSVRPL